MRGASALGRLLERHAGVPLAAFIIWMPVVLTDVGRPTNSTMALISDRRAAQLWDPDHLVSAQMMAMAARHPDRLSEEARAALAEEKVVWDLIALYPAGARWESEPPWPAYWNTPVTDGIEEASRWLSKVAPAAP